MQSRSGCDEGLIYWLGHWRCAMWRVSNTQTLIFIEVVVVAVAVLLLLA